MGTNEAMIESGAVPGEPESIVQARDLCRRYGTGEVAVDALVVSLVPVLPRIR